MNRRLFTLSLFASLALIGCDNTATAPAPEASSNGTEATAKPNTDPITIGYSDWPGWVAWQIALEKGWFEEAGVSVDFKWFDYSSSLSAFASGQLDAIAVTNGDNLINAASGSEGIMILVNDYSAGNDKIVAKKGINSIADLKGKSIGVEKTFVEHLLLNTALADNGMTESDVTLINTATNELPQVFANDNIDAVALWQPNAGQALDNVAGSTAIYTSAEKPGLIYDTLAVSPKSLLEHKEDYKKIIQVWDKVVAYINDPATRDDALNIMSAKVNVSPEQYATYLEGTHLLSVADNQAIFNKTDGLDSLYGSTYNVNKFNINNQLYDVELDLDKLIYPDFIKESN